MTLALTQTHKDILQFFEEPRRVSMKDIARQVGYNESTMVIRVRDLVEEGLLIKQEYSLNHAKPNRYERTT